MAGILGTDFLENVKAQISFESGKIAFSTAMDISPRWGNKRAVLTVFSKRIASRSPQQTQLVLANFSDTPIVVPKSTAIELAEPVSETSVKLVNGKRRHNTVSHETFKAKKAGKKIPHGLPSRRTPFRRKRANM
jgi:hypothetical protein